MFRVALVDDSPLARAAVSDCLAEIPGVQVAAQANDGEEGLALLRRERFDLAILDVEMPRLDGIALLKEMQRERLSTPALMLSSLTREGAITTFRALDLGAIDFVTKPSAGVTFADMKSALQSRVRALVERLELKPPATEAAPAAPFEAQPGQFQALLIGASTGGPQALQQIVRGLPAAFPAPILIVQHMPPLFTAAFAERLNESSAIEVREARHGDALRPGLALLAPGDRHLRVVANGEAKLATLDDGPAVHSHKPSFEPLLASAAEVYGAASVALIMTGMGRDGVDGMLRLRKLGARTLAQDQASSVVFGMNRRAIEAGAVDQIVELKNMVAVLSACFLYQ